MKTRWSVIIPTMNRVDTLIGTLRCLVEQSLPPSVFEVLVVDNGSTDATCERVHDFISSYPKHRFQYISESVPGQLSGRHRGAVEAQAEILTFLDDDVEFSSDFGVHILKSFADQRVAMVGGPSIPRFEHEPPSWMSHYVRWNGRWMTCINLSILHLGDKPLDIAPEYVLGLNFSIRKEALFSLGGFHPDIVPKHLQMFQGDGETGLSLKAKERGLVARYVPEVCVEHIIPATRLTEEYYHGRLFYQGVCDSYTEVRGKKSLVDLHCPVPARERGGVEGIHDRIHNCYVDGYLFHQKAIQASPILMEWVLKDDYWDYMYPEVEADLKFPRSWATELQKDPLGVLGDPGRACKLAMEYIKRSRWVDALHCLGQVERAYPTLSGVRALKAATLFGADLIEEAGMYAEAELAMDPCSELALTVQDKTLLRDTSQGCSESKNTVEPRNNAVSQKAVMNQYKMMAALMQPGDMPAIADTGFQIYSQFDEDGILLYIFSVIGFTNRKVIEVCAGTGEECNTANLIINHGCQGLLFDGNKKNIEHARNFFSKHKSTWLFPPICKYSWITKDNINHIIEEEGFTGEVDLLSLDIDGNDYWIWDAIDCITPRVFICETNNIIPDDLALTIPYKEDFSYISKENYHEDFRSASPLAMITLSKRKGYRLVGAHKYGFNLIFIRDDVESTFFPEIDLASIASSPYTLAERKKRWPLVERAPWMAI